MRQFKHMPTAALALLFAALFATLCTVSATSAQSFTGKTIRIVVPYAAGGTSDILARALSNKVGESLCATVVVDNKLGAGGVLGSDLVAKSPPDCMTLLLTDIGGLTSAPALGAKLPFDVVKDSAPVTMITYSPHLVVVNPAVPARRCEQISPYFTRQTEI